MSVPATAVAQVMPVRSRRIPAFMVAAAAAVLLSGCGNNDNQSTTTTTSATTTPATTSTSSNTSSTTSTTSTTTAKVDGYRCTSNLTLTEVSHLTQKGLCLDDTTFQNCPSSMPVVWPHTGERVTSLRLFKAWNDEWGDNTTRQKAWDAVKTFVVQNNAKVLMGTGVSCNSTYDDLDWEVTLEFLRFLGKEYVLGLGIGNEMDIFWQKGNPNECVRELWQSRYWDMFQKRVDDLDRNGFDNVKVTVVWSMGVLAMKPFLEDPNQATVNSFVTNAFKKYGNRWVWTFNVYAIWDRSFGPDSPFHPHKCEKAIESATGNYNNAILSECRKRMKTITGNDDDPLWVGETGWSTPAPDGVPPLGKNCPDYCSPNTFRRFYAHFLSWNLTTLDDGAKGPDYAFFFTMRDSFNLKAHEGFGLIQTCSDSACKLNGSESPVKAGADIVV